MDFVCMIRRGDKQDEAWIGILSFMKIWKKKYTKLNKKDKTKDMGAVLVKSRAME